MSRRRIKDSPTCSICQHEKRHEIEMLRAAGVSLDAIAAKVPGTHRDAVWRHWTRHVSEDIKAGYLADVSIAEIAERDAKEGGSLLSYLSLVRTTLFNQMLLAASTNDGHRVAVLAGRAIEALKEIGKLTGELSQLSSLHVSTTNIAYVNSPAFAALEAMLLDRLRAYPDALRAVVEGLRQLEGDEGASDGEGRPEPPLLDLNADGGVDNAFA
jgi:hypothetical protein